MVWRVLGVGEIPTTIPATLTTSDGGEWLSALAIDDLLSWTCFLADLQDRYKPTGDYADPKFEKELTRRLVSSVDRLTRNGNYLHLCDQLDVVSAVVLGLGEAQANKLGLDDRSKTLTAVGGTMLYILLTIQIMLGSERKMVVGLRDNQLALLNLSTPLSQIDALNVLLSSIDVSFAHFLRVVGVEDVELVPQPYPAWRNNPSDWPEAEFWDQLTWHEEAFYNQSYLVHPRGAEVRFVDHPLLQSMVLKVKKSVSDPNYLDFLASFVCRDGRLMFHVVEGGHLTQEVHRLSGYSYPYLSNVIARVYHDLVTARDISTATISREGQRAAPREVGFDGECLRFVYAPRVHKGRQKCPRVPMDRPRIQEPHHVTGHKRKANMSEEHRHRILQFERETGLQVFAWLPEGHTFVRPHVSPKVKEGELLGLPQFVRARIQEELRQALQSDTEGE